MELIIGMILGVLIGIYLGNDKARKWINSRLLKSKKAKTEEKK